jgi:cation:H+ antiporter
VPAEHEHSSKPSASGWLWIALTAGAAVPWLIFRFTSNVHEASPFLVSVLAGLAVLGAAFILSWAAEVFQLDVSQALALALLSLIAVLPEYAVSVIFAWRAATDPSQAAYAAANMTGANRLLIGVGWSSVVLLAWWRTREKNSGRHLNVEDAPGQVVNGAVVLHRSQSLELSALALGTLYSFILPLKGGIGLVDAVILCALFAVYAWGTARAPAEEPDLVGPAATIGVLPRALRRILVYGMFAFAAGIIFISADPFAEGLVRSGTLLGVNEFLLVQWLAPLASEAPEFVVALMFGWRGLAGAGLRTLVASKVNQWTLLIGTLGLAYSLALGAPADLPLDTRQKEELFLTSAQSLFALALIANFDLSIREALVLLATFLVQLVFPQTEVRLAFGVFYVLAGVALVLFDGSRRRSVLRLPAMVRQTVGLSS